MTIEIDFKENTDGLVAFGKVMGKGKLNLVDEEILELVSEHFVKLAKNDDLRCLTLEGATSTAFIGGADLTALRRLNSTTSKPFISSIHRLCSLIRKSSFPVIAKMQGYCLGAGLEIAASCDIRIADHSVKCGMPEVRVGVPSVVEAALLPGLIGWGKAREIMLRGNIFGSRECYTIGLIQELAATSKLDAVCKEVEKDILSGGKNAISLQKKLFLEWEDLSLTDGIEKSIDSFSDSYLRKEPQSMIDKFFDKRK